MKPTIRDRFFAWIMIHGDSLNHRFYHFFKEDLLNSISGEVVEIGPGSGINFTYLQPGTKWKGVEPNEAFHETILFKADNYNIKANLIKDSATKIDLPDNFADVVISTLVLCSVDNPEKAVLEIKRVLKPGGKFIFIEHVAALEGSIRRLAQNVLNPVNRFIGDGCNCNRETWKHIENAGFSKLDLGHKILNGPTPIHSPHIMGYAVK